MKFADLAMYQAKREGRNDFRFFSPKMDQEAQARRNLEGELRSAFADEEFELLYQPIVESASGVAISAEALVRWRHPKRGLLKPDEFIPCAEDSGLIAPLGEWVLRRACAEATTWPAEIKVAVNVSAAQCQKGNLVDIVVLALAESGLAPDRLELEFTESVLLNRTDSNLATFHQLRKLGVGIVMDDFGAGFSSLRYLQQFPFHKLKIDRSFVSSLVHDKSSVAIVCAVNTLAKGLNIVTVAEGIETPEQYDLLRLAGCDQMQGFLFSQPAQPSQLKFGQSLRPATTSDAA
jgi:EAL domain-containing protein (putative c-di-GMP-specific phosphodiesterase class I)